MKAFHNAPRSPLVVNFGGGVDSTGILVGLVLLFIAGDLTARPALILFADTGNEIEATYQHVAAFSAWLESAGFPPVTSVRRVDVIATKVSYRTIAENCIANETLPSEAYGSKRKGACSMKWKHESMDAFLFGRPSQGRPGWLTDNGYEGCKPTKLIGYDATETLTGKRAQWAKVSEDDKGFLRYPLVEWGWSRPDCMAAIAANGVTVPVKSACVICPNQKADELDAMVTTDPTRLFEALVVEQVARLGVIGLQKITGLWRKDTKALPGSWVAHAKAKGWMDTLEAHVGQSLTSAVLAIFQAKAANAAAGGYLPFQHKTLVAAFGDHAAGPKVSQAGPAGRALVVAHYGRVIAALQADGRLRIVG